ncbi:hypothetical protein FPV67DRAFT_1680715 [Lyophyllum atratum]|nr:hypothetical protein FPV67DRAFT_1680715 [Lyophyllum atratum]
MSLHCPPPSHVAGISAIYADYYPSVQKHSWISGEIFLTGFLNGDRLRLDSIVLVYCQPPSDASQHVNHTRAPSYRDLGFVLSLKTISHSRFRGRYAFYARTDDGKCFILDDVPSRHVESDLVSQLADQPLLPTHVDYTLATESGDDLPVQSPLALHHTVSHSSMEYPPSIPLDFVELDEVPAHLGIEPLGDSTSPFPMDEHISAPSSSLHTDYTPEHAGMSGTHTNHMHGFWSFGRNTGPAEYEFDLDLDYDLSEVMYSAQDSRFLIDT